MRIVVRRLAAPALVLIAMFAAPAANAVCADPPKPPRMPQGATATDDEMKEGRVKLQTYVNILQTYEACLEKQVKDAPPDTKPELKQKWQATADAAVDAANEIADVYSIQLRAFKARQQ